MISVAILDDHPALRAGLATVLGGEPGLRLVGAVETIDELWPLIERANPHVVLLDYHLPGLDGLLLCRRIKRCSPPPRVLVYSAYASGSLAIPATLAGADGVVGKGLPARELFDAIRRVSRGDRVGPPVTPEMLDHAAARLDGQDGPLFEMAMKRIPFAEMSHVLDLDVPGLDRRLDSLIDRLRIEVPRLDL